MPFRQLAITSSGAPRPVLALLHFAPIPQAWLWLASVDLAGGPQVPALARTAIVCQTGAMAMSPGFPVVVLLIT
ncbi:MAG: hypothetical protein ACYDH5_13960 [Acidimicrobiales bacterium]